MDLDALCLAVSDKTGLSDATGTADRTFLTRVANRSVREVLLDARPYVVAGTITLTAGTTEYQLETALGQNLLSLEGYVQTSDAVRSLTVVTEQELLERRQVSPSGGPARRFTLVGNNLLIVDPEPGAGETWTVYYVPYPTEMSSGSHDPSNTTYGGIPAEFHRAIECYMLAETYERLHDQEAAVLWRQKYDEEIVRTRKRLRRRAGRRLPGFVGAKYPDYTPSSNRRDVYPEY